MVDAKTDLSEKITEIVLSYWKDAASEPLLLSRLGEKLKADQIDYKAMLGEQGLRSFISEEVSSLKIAAHPTQHAHVGAYPADEEFTYSIDVVSPACVSDRDNLIRTRRAFYSFIKALSDLSPDEVEGVVIPSRVIVKLLEGK